MTEHQKRLIKNMTNSITRTKRALEKVRNYFYSNVEQLECELKEKKEKLKLFKSRISRKIN